MASPVTRFAPLSAVTAGVPATVVGVTGSAAIVFSTASAAGADDAELASWMLALGVGMGLTTIGLPLAAALLAGVLVQFGMGVFAAMPPWSRSWPPPPG